MLDMHKYENLRNNLNYSTFFASRNASRNVSSSSRYNDLPSHNCLPSNDAFHKTEMPLCVECREYEYGTYFKGNM